MLCIIRAFTRTANTETAKQEILNAIKTEMYGIDEEKQRCLFKERLTYLSNRVYFQGKKFNVDIKKIKNPDSNTPEDKSFLAGTKYSDVR